MSIWTQLLYHIQYNVLFTYCLDHLYENKCQVSTVWACSVMCCIIRSIPFIKLIMYVTKTLEIKMDAAVVAECIFFIQYMAF